MQRCLLCLRSFYKDPKLRKHILDVEDNHPSCSHRCPGHANLFHSIAGTVGYVVWELVVWPYCDSQGFAMICVRIQWIQVGSNSHQLCCLPSGSSRNIGKLANRTWVGRSLVYTGNNTGPSTELCSTPDVTGNLLDLVPSCTTVICCAKNYVFSLASKFPYQEHFTVSELLTHVTCRIGTKTFDRFKTAACTRSYAGSHITGLCMSHFLKPCCLLWSHLLIF